VSKKSLTGDQSALPDGAVPIPGTSDGSGNPGRGSGVDNNGSHNVSDDGDSGGNGTGGGDGSDDDHRQSALPDGAATTSGTQNGSGNPGGGSGVDNNGSHNVSGDGDSGGNGTGGDDGSDGDHRGGVMPNFSITDMTTGVSSVAGGEDYHGPVPALQRECVILTQDDINITANIPNVFLHSDSGEDALRVLSGTNVLDGSTGSNFLVGGSGTDTFFVDDRGPVADIWSTVVGFHGGDAATVWGVTPQDFDFSWVDNQGAVGFAGLTMHATTAGKPIASLTLTGFTTNDLNGGRLSISFGHTADLPGLPGSDYMLIHAN
jgi:hypothetical protein